MKKDYDGWEPATLGETLLLCLPILITWLGVALLIVSCASCTLGTAVEGAGR